MSCKMTRSFLTAAYAGLCILQTAHAATSREMLVVALEQAPHSVDPRFAGNNVIDSSLSQLLFLPLFYFDENDALKPALAESYVVESGNNIKVKLKRGIHFSNGRAISADDVVATYNRILSVTAMPAAALKNNFDKLSAVSKITDDQVLFSLKSADASFLANLNVGILPAAAANLETDHVFGRELESGPFAADKIADDEWIFVRNQKYDGAASGIAKSAFSSVHFKIISDVALRTSAVLKNEVDLVQNGFDADRLAEIQKAEGDVTIGTRTAFSTTALAFNFRDPMLRNLNFRKAVASAINTDEILRFGLQGMGVAAAGMFPPQTPFADPSLKSIAYNLELAKKFLADAKNETGKAWHDQITMKISLQKERVAVAKAIAGQLARLGLTLNIEALGSVSFVDQLNAGNAQMWMTPWTDYRDFDHLRYVFHSRMTPPTGANRGAYSNAKVDGLLEAGLAEYQMSRRAPLYFKAQEILAEELPYVYLWHRPDVAVFSKRLNGVKAGEGFLNLTEIEKH